MEANALMPNITSLTPILFNKLWAWKWQIWLWMGRRKCGVLMFPTRDKPKRIFGWIGNEIEIWGSPSDRCFKETWCWSAEAPDEA